MLVFAGNSFIATDSSLLLPVRCFVSGTIHSWLLHLRTIGLRSFSLRDDSSSEQFVPRTGSIVLGIILLLLFRVRTTHFQQFYFQPFCSWDALFSKQLILRLPHLRKSRSWDNSYSKFLSSGWFVFGTVRPQCCSSLENFFTRQFVPGLFWPFHLHATRLRSLRLSPFVFGPVRLWKCLPPDNSPRISSAVLVSSPIVLSPSTSPSVQFVSGTVHL